MAWNIRFFETARGESPVQSFILKQNASAKAKISRLVRLLLKFGSLLGMPYVRKLTREISELRIKGKEEIRILYCYKKGNFYLLHAFKKQTQETPRKEIDLAFSRYQLLTK